MWYKGSVLLFIPPHHLPVFLCVGACVHHFALVTTFLNNFIKISLTYHKLHILEMYNLIHFDSVKSPSL